MATIKKAQPGIGKSGLVKILFLPLSGALALPVVVVVVVGGSGFTLEGSFRMPSKLTFYSELVTSGSPDDSKNGFQH